MLAIWGVSFVSLMGVSFLPSSVQTGVHLLVVLVYADELTEQLVVDGAVVGVGLVAGGEPGGLRNIAAAEPAQGDGGDEGGAAGVGQVRLLQLPDRAVQDIGVDLAP